MVTPLDLVKCRLQVDPAKYKNVVNGFKVNIFFINTYTIVGDTDLLIPDDHFYQ